MSSIQKFETSSLDESVKILGQTEPYSINANKQGVPNAGRKILATLFQIVSPAIRAKPGQFDKIKTLLFQP